MPTPVTPDLRFERLRFNTPGAWLIPPRDGATPADLAAPFVAWMGEAWPSGPAPLGELPAPLGELPAHHNEKGGENRWAANAPHQLAYPWGDRVAVHLVLSVFWAMWDHLQSHRHAVAVWKVDYEIHGPASDPSPGRPWLSVQFLADPGGPQVPRFPFPSGLAELLAEGTAKMGQPMSFSSTLRATDDLKDVLRACLGDSYARWWAHAQLERTLSDRPPARPPKPRM